MKSLDCPRSGNSLDPNLTSEGCILKIYKCNGCHETKDALNLLFVLLFNVTSLCVKTSQKLKASTIYKCMLHFLKTK